MVHLCFYFEPCVHRIGVTFPAHIISQLLLLPVKKNSAATGTAIGTCDVAFAEDVTYCCKYYSGKKLKMDCNHECV